MNILGITKDVLGELQMKRMQINNNQEIEEKSDDFGESFDMAINCLFGKDSEVF